MPPLTDQVLRQLQTRRLERERLIATLDTAMGVEPVRVYAATVLASARTENAQWGIGSSRCRSTLVWRTETTFKLRIRSTHGPQSRDGERQYSAFGVRHVDRPAVVTLVVFKDARAFHDGIRRLVRFNRRDLVSPSLSDKRCRHIVEAFSGAEAFDDLVVTRASVRLRREVTAEDRPGAFSSVAWPTAPLHEAFQWVWDNNGWFRTLAFAATRGHHEIGRFSLGRRGEVTATRRFSSAFRSLCVPVGETFDEDERVFGHRARRDLSFGSVRPLVIAYGKQLFSEPAGVRQFVTALRSFPHGTVSVYHGNPYLHAAILDQIDGSSTEVWVTGSDRVLLVPQMRATTWGLKRVVQHVFDTFAEGDVSDHQVAT